MWNHAPAMWKQMSSSGYSTPELTPRDTADLMAFLFVAGYLEEPGQPQRGQGILARKGCRKCHTTGEDEQKIGPDLALWSENVNPILWSQRLWNHAPAMGQSMKELGVERPIFTEEEMGDLITYLFAIRYFEAPGDPEMGTDVFMRNCATCHGEAGQGDVGPALDSLGARSSPTFMATTLWNHGPQMYQAMRERELDWPRLDGNQMRDLIAYLRSLT